MAGFIDRYRCLIGLHRFADLQRVNLTWGQEATQQCLYCAKRRFQFRVLAHAEGPMHPRATEPRVISIIKQG